MSSISDIARIPGGRCALKTSLSWALPLRSGYHRQTIRAVNTYGNTHRPSLQPRSWEPDKDHRMMGKLGRDGRPLESRHLSVR
jgi:hypothetical protein